MVAFSAKRLLWNIRTSPKKLILYWSKKAAYTQRQLTQRVTRMQNDLDDTTIKWGIGFLISSGVVFSLTQQKQHLPLWLSELLHEYGANLSTEFLSLSVTLLGIGYVLRQQYKTQLLYDLSSPVKSELVRSIRKLMFEGWLYDGSCRGISIIKGNFDDLEGLRGADLKEVDFIFCSFKNVEFDNAHLEGADLFAAYFESAFLWETHFENALLLAANFNNANLSDAHLQGADLREITYNSKTEFTNALYNSQTRFSPDFDPKKAGMIKVTKKS